MKLPGASWLELLTVIVAMTPEHGSGAGVSTLELQLHALVGATVVLPCHTTVLERALDGSFTLISVDWRYHWSPLDTPDFIYSNDRKYSNMPDRYNVTATGDGDYSLTISGAQVNDTGLYTCIEAAGYGKKHTISLIVSADEVLLVSAPSTGGYVTATIILAIIVAVLLVIFVILVICKRRKARSH